MQSVYDVIIIGAGPAGITAGVYAARKVMKALIITNDIGGQTTWSGDIENYTGYQFITGLELTDKFQEHAKKNNLDIHENEAVKAIDKTAEIVTVKTVKGDYKARTVIIASGKRARELNVEGESEFRNKGLTYCATCDGPLFAQKEVAVIGGGNSALEAVLQLLNIATKVYVINSTDNLTADVIMQEKARQSEKVVIFNNAEVKGILGDKFVSSIKIKASGEERLLNVQGVFVEIGLIPNTDFPTNLEKNELGEIKVNCRNETSIPAIFAAGDATDVPEKQIIIAAGEGAKAALSAFKYLSTH